jgi:ankyrin repeat protein
LTDLKVILYIYSKMEEFLKACATGSIDDVKRLVKGGFKIPSITYRQELRKSGIDREGTVDHSKRPGELLFALKISQNTYWLTNNGLTIAMLKNHEKLVTYLYGLDYENGDVATETVHLSEDESIEDQIKFDQSRSSFHMLTGDIFSPKFIYRADPDLVFDIDTRAVIDQMLKDIYIERRNPHPRKPLVAEAAIYWGWPFTDVRWYVDLILREPWNHQHLLLACQKRDLEFVKELVNEPEKNILELLVPSRSPIRPNPSEPHHPIQSPVDMACQQGRLELVQYLCQQINRQNRLDTLHLNYLSTGVFLAAFRGHLSIVSYCLDEGIDRDICDRKGYSLVRASVRHLALVQFLVESGAPVDKACPSKRPNPPSALALAVSTPHIGDSLESAKYLIGRGANAKITYPKNSPTDNLVSTLCNSFAMSKDLSSDRYRNLRPLIIHTQEVLLDFLQLLITHGSDPRFINVDGETVIHRILRSDSWDKLDQPWQQKRLTKLLDFLYERGLVDLSQQDQSGRTAYGYLVGLGEHHHKRSALGWFEQRMRPVYQVLDLDALQESYLSDHFLATLARLDPGSPRSSSVQTLGRLDREELVRRLAEMPDFCELCGEPLYGSDWEETGLPVRCLCGHEFHQNCLDDYSKESTEDDGRGSCPIGSACSWEVYDDHQK